MNKKLSLIRRVEYAFHNVKEQYFDESGTLTN